MKQKSNYKILDIVGRGQFGKVFVAVERKNGTLVALKELKPKQLSTSSFLRELNFLVTLNHFNIVTCRALEHYRNNRYIVMDYCEGGTLRDLLNNSAKLSFNHSLKLVIDLLSGLEFAHHRGIIHRDIKPENILLKISDRTWTAHISDFGIAQLHQNTPTIMGNTGSPAYMAPEQFYGQYSYSCDLYAVGIILYELVVGERPFSGTPKELLSAHLNQPVTIPKSVPFILRSAIAKSLQKMPHRRFSSATEMLKSLKLAQTILQTKHYTSALSLTESPLLTPISVEILPQPVTHLAFTSKQVYLARGDRLCLDYRDVKKVNRWEVTLDNQIRSLQLSSQGCLITTSSSLYYLPYDVTSKEFQFFRQTLLPIISFPTTNLVTAIDHRGYWLTASYLPYRSKTPAFEIFSLPNARLRRSQVNRKHWKFLVALDCRHGLGIYQNSQQRTEFHLFNRRGNWLANFTVQLQLNSVVYNPLFPNQFLATEVNNPNVAILITLEKFKIKRIELEITPTIVVCCSQGYLLSDRQGKIAIIDGDSFEISQLRLSLPTESVVTAIATSTTQLLVVSASSQVCLQRFCWN